MNCIIRTACAAVTGLTVAHGFAQTPTVTNVTMSQDQSRKVTITYVLDMPAVVTLDIETNVTGTAEWVSIGGENIHHVVGEVNAYIKETTPEQVHEIFWQPDVSWPNHRIRNNGARAVVRAWAPDAPPDYMLIDLAVKSNVTYYASLGSLPFGHPTNDVYKLDKMLLRKVHAAGSMFRMGATKGEERMNGYLPDGTPVYFINDIASYARAHTVSMTNDYYLSVYPVTQQQFFDCVGSRPDNYSVSKVEPYDMCPVASYSHYRLRGDNSVIDWPSTGHALAEDSRLNSFRKQTGVELDLPTEAQWEFACRAGEDRWRYDGASKYDEPQPDRVAWYGDAAHVCRPVGQKDPNAWGFYDMYGNGYQLCLDYWSYGYEGAGTVEPVGPATGSDRVLRGSPSNYRGNAMASAHRENLPKDIWQDVPTYTFRLAAPAVAR